MSKIYEALNKAQREASPAAQPPGELLPLPDAPEIAPGDTHGDGWREFEVLRSGIEGSLGTLVDKTVAFASSVSGEGTSTVAARFALALQGLRWVRPVLVDANLRNPSVRGLFDLPPSDGLVEILGEKSTVERAATHVAGGFLGVIGEGRTPGNPQMLLTPKNVARLLSELRRSFNCVILDAPAVIGHPETKTIAALSDGVVLVIETARTKREVALRSKDALTAAGAHILGTVLNKRKYVIPDLLYKRI